VNIEALKALTRVHDIGDTLLEKTRKPNPSYSRATCAKIPHKY